MVLSSGGAEGTAVFTLMEGLAEDSEDVAAGALVRGGGGEVGPLVRACVHTHSGSLDYEGLFYLSLDRSEPFAVLVLASLHADTVLAFRFWDCPTVSGGGHRSGGHRSGRRGFGMLMRKYDHLSFGSHAC